ncbi:MAG: carboxypeptidase regulatory-like domain-containing protein, partial [Pirellulales bacterium]|nr:carboxypeptidase regulatory-like domain-containing protein [Pirellulales bacterium]
MNTAFRQLDRKGHGRAGKVVLPAIAAALAIAAPTSAQVKCQKVFHDPFDGNQEVRALTSHGGGLYAAVGGYTKAGKRTQKVFRMDEQATTAWSDVTPKWVKPLNGIQQFAMHSFKGLLFIGTKTGEVYRLDATGSQLVKSFEGSISDMAIFKTAGKEYLYVYAAKLHRTPDGKSWEDLGHPIPLPSNVFVDTQYTMEVSATSSGERLYVGFGYTESLDQYDVSKNTEGIQIWRTQDGTTWKLFKKVSSSKGPGSGPSMHIHAMKAYGGHLYVGAYEGGSSVFRSDGSPASWETYLVAQSGAIIALEGHAGRLFAGRCEYSNQTLSEMSGEKQLYFTVDGTSWSAVPNVPVTAVDSRGVRCMASHHGKLYFGTTDWPNGGEVFEVTLPPASVDLADAGKSPETLAGTQKQLLAGIEEKGELLTPLGPGETLDESDEDSTPPEDKPSGSTVSPPHASSSSNGRGLHGHVLALDQEGDVGDPVAGATIELQNQAGQVVASQLTTDQNGYYRADLDPGVYYYRVSAPGFKDEDVKRGITSKLSDGYAVWDFFLTPGDDDREEPPPEIIPARIGSLKGAVLEEKPDGRLAAVADAVITLRNDEGTPPTVDVITGPPDAAGGRAGQYEVVLQTGLWQATAAAPGFDTLVDPSPIPIVAGRQARRNFIFRRPRPKPAPEAQGIVGRVFLRGPDASTDSLAKVAVSIGPVPSTEGPPAALKPGTDGGFRRNLDAGVYRIAARLEGYRGAEKSRAVYDGKYTRVDLVLAPPAKPEIPAPVPPDTPSAAPGTPPVTPAPESVRIAAKVHVFRQTDDDVTQEQPLEGANVVLRVRGEALADARIMATDQHGTATFADLEKAGMYEAVAHHEGLTGRKAMSVTEGGRNDVKIVLAAAASPPVTPPSVMPPPATP